MAVNELAADRTITLPLLTSDAFVPLLSISAAQTADFTATIWTVYWCDTTGNNALTVTLPAITSSDHGARIVIADVGGDASTYNITIAPDQTDPDNVGSQTSGTSDIITGDYNTVTLMAIFNGTSSRWIYL